MKSLLLQILFLEPSKKLNPHLQDFIFLFVRVSIALLMFFAHGQGKWANFSKIAPNFPDPFGFLGSQLSLALVVGAEVFGALLMALGLFTRWSSFSLFFTMFVAAFVVHLNDPFKDKELAVIYALVFLFFTIAGGGKYSLDYLIKKKLS